MPETDLATLIHTMSPRLLPGLFAFATVDTIPAGLDPVMTFREAEGITLILPQHQAIAVDLAWTFPSRMITLEVQSSLDALGFLAAITARLAEAGISVNPVSGFHHDHLFVPERRAEEAMLVLRGMASGN